MSSKVPPEEIRICERCSVEFRCRQLEQQFCCNSHGASKDELQVALAAVKKFPSKKFNFFRVGYPAVHKLRIWEC